MPAVTDSGLLTICLNPVLQRTLAFPALRTGGVNRTEEHRVDASGKGINVARVLTQLGARATALTTAGGRFADCFLELVQRDGLTVERVDSGAEIRWCTTVIDRRARTTTELIESAPTVSAGTEATVRAAFARLLPHHHTVTLSGTKAPGFSAALYADLARAARAAGRRLIVDLAGPDLIACLAERPDVAKPNYEEFLATFLPARAEGALDDPETEAAVRELAPRLARESGAALVLTRGPRAALVATGTELWEAEPEAIAPLNTTGCGDAFTAALAHALALGQDLRAAVAAAHRAGAANARQLRPGVIE